MNKRVSQHSHHVKFWKEEINWLKKWEVVDGGKIKCIQGWIITAFAVIMLWEDLHSNYDFMFLFTRNLNQDPIKNLFCCLLLWRVQWYSNVQSFSFRYHFIYLYPVYAALSVETNSSLPAEIGKKNLLCNNWLFVSHYSSLLNHLFCINKKRSCEKKKDYYKILLCNNWLFHIMLNLLFCINFYGLFLPHSPQQHLLLMSAEVYKQACRATNVPPVLCSTNSK